VNSSNTNPFDEALAHHQAGRLAQAESLYRQILSQNPEHGDALHMLGVVLFQSNRAAQSVDLIRRTVGLNPHNTIYLANLALILTQLGRGREAADALRQAVKLEPNSPELQNNLGNALLATEQFQEAAAAYTRAASMRVDSPEIFSNLGNALLRSGDPAKAEQSYRRSVSLRPDHAEVHFNLGLSCGMQSKWDEAIQAFQEAIRLRPDYAEAYNNLGNALSERSRYADAEPVYRKAIALRPDYAQAHNNLGVALHKLGRSREAVPVLRKALELRPANPNVLYHLANALIDDGHAHEAVAALREALAIKPDHAESYVTLSLIHAGHKRWEEAHAAARQGQAAQPTWAGGHNNIGSLLKLQGRNQEALAEFDRAIALDPRFREALINRATALHELGRPDEALAAFERAFAICGESIEGLTNYSNTLKEVGQIAQSIAASRRAAELSTDPLRFHNLLLELHYEPTMSAAQIFEENRRFGQSLSARVAADRRPHSNLPNPDRRLRIGYVTADLRHHVVGYNMLPLFEHHDHDPFEVFCYSNTPKEDDITARFRTLCDHWRDIRSINDALAADLVRRDGIDVLIDLSLHTADNRLGVFARKAAPVQFTFAGYPGTTGLSEIDYRLTDPYIDPPGTDGFYTESSIRLPHSFWCYRPLNHDQSVAPLPALANGFITFGALTNFCKINAGVLALWAKVLSALPSSRLLLIARPGAHRARTKATFAAHGVAPERIEFLDYLPRAQYLETYHRIDLGLDTFPYNGHTTSLDSYWMGVPVVSLIGQTAVGRAGFCQLTHLGLPELAARTESDFVRIATDLANDLPRLAALRAELRPRMERSPLMDAHTFTRSIEAAYRQAWRIWCAKQRGASV
jgi:protein O-GlcNAc transferase